MDNNPLTYIMTTPNLEVTHYWLVKALAWFNFELEYQKGHDNPVVDTLSWVTTQLDPDLVKSILNRVTLGTAHHAKVNDPAVVEGDYCLEQEVHVMVRCVFVQMHMTDWGWSPEGRFGVEHSIRLAKSAEEDRSQGTPGRTCIQQRRQTDDQELTEFYSSSESLIPVISA